MKIKSFRSPEYNWDLDMVTGEFIRYGKTLENDPEYSPVGPEILDLEISTICNGIGNAPCKHCYKSNTSKGTTMSFDTFKDIFTKLKKNLSQIAFGIGDIDSNPDMWKMFEYCRSQDVFPNITINGSRMKEEYFVKLAYLCGTVCVSYYGDDNLCFNAVEKLIKNGLKQVSIHQLVSYNTVQDCYNLQYALKNDSRLRKLYSVTLLKLKQKGRGETYKHLSDIGYQKTINKFITDSPMNVGFDTCFAPEVETYLKSIGMYEQNKDTITRCDSSLFSAYINVSGDYWHCSFVEDNPNWKGINVLQYDDFIKEVWLGEEVKKFRGKLLTNNRRCPTY